MTTGSLRIDSAASPAASGSAPVLSFAVRPPMSPRQVEPLRACVRARARNARTVSAFALARLAQLSRAADRLCREAVRARLRVVDGEGAQ